MGNRPLKSRIQRKPGADNASQSQADNKQHMISGLGHGLNDGVDAQSGGGKAHGVHQGGLVFFSDPLAQGAADDAAGKDGGGVGNGSDHFMLLLYSG